MKSTQDDAEWIWDRNKFVNRTYLMKEMFQNYYEGEEDWNLPEVCKASLTILPERLEVIYFKEKKNDNNNNGMPN